MVHPPLPELQESLPHQDVSVLHSVHPQEGDEDVGVEHEVEGVEVHKFQGTLDGPLSLRPEPPRYVTADRGTEGVERTYIRLTGEDEGTRTGREVVRGIPNLLPALQVEPQDHLSLLGEPQGRCLYGTLECRNVLCPNESGQVYPLRGD